MTTRRTEQERDIAINEPYRRAETAPPETAARARTEAARPEMARGRMEQAPPEPARPAQAEPGGADTAGRMSFADRVTGGPVWSGFLIGLATWIFLQVALVALGLNAIRAGQGETVQRSAWWWSLAAGLIALFIGGLVAGMASRWHTASAGALQGLTVWALLFVVLLVLSAVGAGLGFGAFSDTVGITGTDVTPEAIETARDAAGVAVLLLVLTAAAATIGGIVGGRFATRTPRASDLPARANRS